MDFSHKPVMLEQCISMLNIKPDGIYYDGTAGGGGHSAAIAAKLSTQGRLVCFDRDSDAISVCRERLTGFAPDIQIKKANFSDAASVLNEMGVYGIDGAILDLGVSSRQLDCAERGFSYSKSAPLDMRMDKSAALSAFEVVNEYSETNLAEIIFKYGEERFARKIASFIVRERQKCKICDTVTLAEIIKSAIPASMRRSGGNPAKRTFQAIRIEVNGELAVLPEAVNSLISLLNHGGRLA
ncbi:MAG: 16S rRNA (cytosine(1402)-N(4))-methyltransferase RsmH, partial [Clostridiales bacterium]|nr:16S rRNA (cytosine(1402)-N(4))-methyltransferase RsmH [Clostridiales bacterium]